MLNQGTEIEEEAMTDLAAIGWPNSWRPIRHPDDERDVVLRNLSIQIMHAIAYGGTIPLALSIVDELHREVISNQQHILYGIQCRPIAYDAHRGHDFLFATDERDKPFAVVHFTWNIEHDTRWPSTTIFQTLKEFLEWARKNPNL
jgi:hypothetical protein